ncbi:MAG: UDP-2,3-diacylglucosamine diphosphatase LpxI [Paracoccaceae bacterium]|nr:UDP-2,3-diacylglucosamine diphosphatase LpxI [Paracoccaceae bacterium]MDE2915880.1 UDP-2,3-diacylglucosamine diphosphatase LpxI [Paracoccaceae bacterium]
MKHEEPRYFLLIAGRGSLPKLVYEKLVSCGDNVEITLLPGSEHHDLTTRHTKINPDNFLDLLQKYRGMGVEHVVLAGGVDRPNQTSISFKQGETNNQINIMGGDDSILKQFLTVIEEIGFKIWGVHQVIPQLVNHNGVLTEWEPSSTDKSDIILAEEIVKSIGNADIGQAAIVRNNRCIAVETISTDWMLDSIKDVYSTFTNGLEERGGILIKASKPNQDLRVDLPTIGPNTIQRVVSLGMSGLVIESGKVILIDLPKVIQMANQGGIFIWSKSINRNIREKYS